MTTLVYLLRHGATTLNRLVPYRLQGRAADPPLDSEGQDQARRAAETLASLPISAVYSSPLARAFETAAIVALPHRLTPVAVPALIEADIGRWEGLTWDEARTLDPDHHAHFHAHPGATPYPGGESFLEVSRRVGPALAELAAAHTGEQIIVVGHNVVNRACLATLLGLPIDRARGLHQANGGINLIQYDGPSARVVTLNATLHL